MTQLPQQMDVPISDPGVAGEETNEFRMFRATSAGRTKLASPGDVELDNLLGTGADIRNPAEDTPDTSLCTRVVFRISFVFFVLRILAAIASLAGGSALLRSIYDKPFSKCFLLYAVGVAAVVYGVVFVAYTIAAVVYYAAKRRSSSTTVPFYDAGTPAAGIPRWKFVLISIAHIAVPLLTAVIAIALSILSFWLYSMSRQLPSLDVGVGGAGTRLRNNSVRVWRDTRGLLYVEAHSQHDALFGQGFAHAQDRLWQMEFMRLAAKGRLAEYLGDAALKFDKQTRSLGFNKAGETLCDGASAASRALMQSYVDGINFYLTTQTQRPPEFLFMTSKLLFFHEPEPFSVLDVCYAAVVLQWQLSLNILNEIERFTVFWNTHRTYDQVEELYVNFTNASHTIVTAAELNIDEAACVAARAREAEDARIERNLYDTYMSALRTQHNSANQIHAVSSTTRRFEAAEVRGDRMRDLSKPQREPGKRGTKNKELDIKSFKRPHASNAWSGRSAGPPGTQGAVGASDPHLSVDLPSVWYWSNLSFPDADGNVFYTSGVGLAGIPGVHVARTSHVSWGITMSMTDLEDLFLLVPDPARPDTHYIVNGTSVAFTSRVEVIAVSGKSDVTLVVQESIYGPVVTDALELPQPLKFAVTGRMLQPDASSINSFLGFMDPAVTNVSMFRDRTLRGVLSPGFSIASQDAAGAVGWALTGSHYLRAAGHTGKYPTLGNGSFDYRGVIPYDALPHQELAPSSTSATFTSCANQKIYPDGYPYSLGYDYEWAWRGRRIQTSLADNATQLSSIDFHQRLQSDVRNNVWVDDFVPFLQSTNGNSQAVAFRQMLTARGVIVCDDLLASWNGDCSTGSRHCTRFLMFLRSLMLVPSDAVAALRRADILDSVYWNPHGRLQSRMLLGTEGPQYPTPLMLQQCQALWKRNNATSLPAVANWCTIYAAQAFNEVADIPEASVAIWGVNANALIGKHLMLEDTILECLFQRLHYKDGDFSSINCADFSYHQEGDFETSYASSMRQLYDWSPGAAHGMRLTFPGGNSGNPYSEFYQNLWDSYFTETYEKLGGSDVMVHASQILSR